MKNDEKKIFKSLADFPKSDIFKNVRNAISQNRMPEKNHVFWFVTIMLSFAFFKK
jgi:hypothetical protein